METWNTLLIMLALVIVVHILYAEQRQACWTKDKENRILKVL